LPNNRVFVDNKTLKVIAPSLAKTVFTVNKDNGMISVPQFTSAGVSTTVLYDPRIKIGENMEIKSEINPSLNGTYRVFKLDFNLTNVLNKNAQATDGMLPAKILEYNRATNRAKVQPLIMQITENGKVIKRPILMSIPVLQYGGGGFLLSFDLKAGDIGWIKANDRDISKFLSSYTNTTPNTNRLKNFSDGVFIPI